MNYKIQTQGQSPSAILQQNERDDARLFLKFESSLSFCADAQIQTANSRMPIKHFSFTS